jgi:hypothetical protein
VDGIVGGDVGFSFVIFDGGEGISDESKHFVWKSMKNTRDFVIGFVTELPRDSH